MKRSGLTQELVRRVLDYDPETGVFTWKEPPSRRVAVGQRAGVVATNGYRYISVMGEKIVAQRLSWFYVHGVWPEENVSPVNGDRDDVSINNLALRTTAELARGNDLRATNRSGMKGVSWNADHGKWVASITRDYRRVHLGYFDTKEDAAAAYEAAVGGKVPNGGKTYSQDEIKQRRRVWMLWRRVLKRAHGKTGWVSAQDFAATIGIIPSPKHELAPRDEAQVIGPGNFVWVAPAPMTAKALEDRAYRERHPERVRAAQLKRDFGISLEEYTTLHVAQKGVCAICQQPETTTRNGKPKMLAVDHDHGTGDVRGLLCHACNTGIGSFQDDPRRLQAAITYLDEHAKRMAEKAAAQPETNVVPFPKESA